MLYSSGGSVCHQNIFPGGYYQYACGASTDAQTIATAYSGQNWASQLKIIYTQLTLATTQSASSTVLSTTTITQSPSSSFTPSSTTSSTISSTLQTITSTSSQTSATSSSPVGAQSVANTSAATVAPAGISPQAQAGIIAGSVVGGVGVIFAILGLCCGLMRRRQRQKAEERARSMSFPTQEKTNSIR
jgi:ABC-type dipeptide/oligopeptide/nickel transport system ATPase subunit